MAPFSAPAPQICPLKVNLLNGTKHIDTNTKIDMWYDSSYKFEIFYTLDGTTPQPYAGIVQGSKLHKFKSPICLPAGKVTIKAITISEKYQAMRSNVITKCFKVTKAERSQQLPNKHKKLLKIKSPNDALSNQTDIGLLLENSADVSKKVLSDQDEFDKDNMNECDEYPLLPKVDSTHNMKASLHDNEDSNDSIDRSSADVDETIYEEDLSFTEQHKSAFRIPDNFCNIADDTNLDKISIANGAFKPEDTSSYSCTHCQMAAQKCSKCHLINAMSSKYCIKCGEKLYQCCTHCKEINLNIAEFCQSCGKKLELRNTESVSENSSPKSSLKQILKKSSSSQTSFSSINQFTQTSPAKSIANAQSSNKMKLPPHSPGRGYWHQQLDYICNHLKSVAYNDEELRKSISKPCLGPFKSIDVDDSTEDFVISISFSSFKSA